MIQNIQVKGLVKRVSTDSAGKHNSSPFLSSVVAHVLCTSTDLQASDLRPLIIQ